MNGILSNGRLFVFMAVLVMSGIAPLSAEETVPLVNPSFEEQGEAEDRAAGWDRWGNWINRQCDWNPVYDGSCIIGYHHYRLEDNESSGIFQNVNVEPGRYYTFSIRANADQPGDGFNGAKEVELRLETTLYGQQATIASKKYPVKYLAGNDDWSWLRVSSVAPTDTMRLLIIVHPSEEITQRDGAVKFDAANLTVKDISSVTATE